MESWISDEINDIPQKFFSDIILTHQISQEPRDSQSNRKSIIFAK